jgi:uncharacterized SAM-binding protein YcdF (DUF218 family)
MMIAPACRRAARGALTAALLLGLGAAVFFLFVCALVVVQGRRDEARRAGAAVVLLGTSHQDGPARQAALDHALDLYKRGLVSRIVLAGPPPSGAPPSLAAQARESLRKRGLPDVALVADERGTTDWERMRAAAERMRAQGLGSAVVVADFSAMLWHLKMARDLGLDAAGSPPSLAPLSHDLFGSAGAVARGAGEYLAYLFARQ